jgi:hypothetical protein
VKRSTLLLMQIAGAVTLLAYPMVLLASLMSLAAEPGAASGLVTASMRLLFAASLFYPLIWGLLWFASWRAFKRGRPVLAALLSSPPLLVLAAFAGLMVFGSAYEALTGRGYSAEQTKEAQRVAATSPLLAAAMRFDNWESSWPEFEAAINRADRQQLTTAVRLRPVDMPEARVTGMPGAPSGPIVMRTPLGFILERSNPGSDYDLTTARPHFVDAARLMIARGAALAPEEIAHNPEIPRILEAIRRAALPPRDRP